MNEEQKKNVHDKYKIALQKGERFWPDSIFKDLLVSLAIFVLLIMLATFIGVPGEPKADPSDSAYVPKPEWYFLFLFKFLAVYGQIPLLGKIEWIATAVIPGLVILLLFVLPLIDRNPYRHYSRRSMALSIMGVFVVSMVVLTVISGVPAISGNSGMSIMTLLQFLTGLVIPILAYIILIGSSFLAKKSAPRAPSENRETPAGTGNPSPFVSRLQKWTAVSASVLMVVVAVVVVLLAPPVAAGTEVQLANTLTEQIILGQDLYSINCVECHGANGEGGEVVGVEGFEGVILTPINTKDLMYTFTDETLANIIAYGQQEKENAMPPFSRTYGGTLSPSEIDYMVTFLRYSWDDRSVMPAGAVSTIPALAPGEVPSWDVHIQALVKRYCVSCHRAGKQNNNNLMTTYEEMLTTGDNAPLITAGDPESLMLKLINGQEGEDPVTGKVIRQMPPTKLLNLQYVDMLTRWVMNGMPQTADEASKLKAVPMPGLAINLTGDPTAGVGIFEAQCVKCHGEAGALGVENPGSADGTVPSLNPIDPEIKNADPKTFAYNLDLFIQNGSTPEGESPKLTMPSFGTLNVLTQQQIADVIAYVMNLNK
jgi:mono/diheme cytochrome c family protein